MANIQYRIRSAAFACFIFIQANTYAQPSDSTYVPVHSKEVRKKFYQTGIFKSAIVPAALIGYGVSTIHGHGFPSSAYIYQEVHEHLKIHQTNIDDYLQYLPYVGLVGLNLLKVKSKNDLINTTVLTVKSVALNAALVFAVKSLTHIARPDSANPREYNSFPSGHTANAFAAATLVHKEFGGSSVWYSVGAYSVATTVGVFRILNNRHWFSDVLAGAGFGILSVNLIYLTHQYRWGKNPGLLFVPSYNQKSIGVFFSKTF